MPWELKHSVIADANRPQAVWEFVSDVDKPSPASRAMPVDSITIRRPPSRPAPGVQPRCGAGEPTQLAVGRSENRPKRRRGPSWS